MRLLNSRYPVHADYIHCCWDVCCPLQFSFGPPAMPLYFQTTHNTQGITHKATTHNFSPVRMSSTRGHVHSNFPEQMHHTFFSCFAFRSSIFAFLNTYFRRMYYSPTTARKIDEVHHLACQITHSEELSFDYR